LLKRFVESEAIRKVCYDAQESLKPILALYPRFAGCCPAPLGPAALRLYSLTFSLLPADIRNLVDPKVAAYVLDPEMKSYDFLFLATRFNVEQSPCVPLLAATQPHPPPLLTVTQQDC